LRRIILATAIVLMFGTQSTAAPTDIADVFPANTLVFAELHNPAELGPQLAALFKGTPLEDSIPFIHAKKDGAKTLSQLRAKTELAELALFVSPEVLSEFRKVGGVAVGLVGFNGRGEPEFAVAVLTGDSAATGLAARAFITTSPTIRKVSELEKIPVFQHRAPAINYDENGAPILAKDQPLTAGEYEPTFAYTPGLFVAGTSKRAIAPVISRFLGTEKDSLRTTDKFKAAASEFRKPGVFFFADTTELFAKTNGAGRLQSVPLVADLLAWVQITANGKSLKSLAGNLQLRDGGLALTLGGTFDRTQNSPLFDVFAGAPVKVDTLHHARKPASFAATVSLPEKNRAAALFAFLDSLAKANGELGRLPSDILKEAETKHKLATRDELFAKLQTVTLIQPTKQELAKDAKPWPMLVLHFADAPSATAIEAAIPKLVAEIANEKDALQPATETIAGAKNFSLSSPDLPWKSPIHYTRKDNIVVIGLDRKHVANAVTADAATSVLSDKTLAVPPGEYSLMGTLQLSALFTALGEQPKADGPVRPIPAVPGGVPPTEETAKALEKARVAFFAALAEFPPSVLTVRRKDDQLRIEVFQAKVQGATLTPIINAGVELLELRPNTQDPNQPPRLRIR
jgi:hypothetical protein